jgi:nitrogenase molybdenum-iron protein alpha/beta subunit
MSALRIKPPTKPAKSPALLCQGPGCGEEIGAERIANARRANVVPLYHSHACAMRAYRLRRRAAESALPSEIPTPAPSPSPNPARKKRARKKSPA